jgi:hypothetical protein
MAEVERPRGQEFAAIVIAPERLNEFLTDAKIMEATGVRQQRPDGGGRGGPISGTRCSISGVIEKDFNCADSD